VTRKLPTLALLAVLLIFPAFICPVFVFGADASSEDDVASVISQAEDSVVSAYEALLEAEEAGANVSALLARLNEAAMLLAEADIAFGLGDFDVAILSADSCYEIGEEVWLEAIELQFEAHEARVMDAGLTISGSIFGVVAVVFVSFWGWRFFKRRYVGRVLGMKPEVARDES